LVGLPDLNPGPLGIPSADWPRFRSWSDSILKLSYTISGGDQAAVASAEFFRVMLEMAEYGE
jgi:hypothetical protein